ncbi:MAG: hypothetical protein SH818_02670 [Saprospiraceae bacterium]|nr:hypothetical protein [Saprospiraceae bacterium]
MRPRLIVFLFLIQISTFLRAQPFEIPSDTALLDIHAVAIQNSV